MKKLPLMALAMSLTFISCEKEDPQASASSSSSTSTSSHQCGTSESDRIGARCKDGTSSTATGQGACSGHGGVKYWLCK